MREQAHVMRRLATNITTSRKKIRAARYDVRAAE
jgi:hypothetical protein